MGVWTPLSIMWRMWYRRTKFEEISLKPHFGLPKNWFYLLKCNLKVMKNAFYFILKALFILKIFKYFNCWRYLISKFITSQTMKQIITMCILPNISRSKDNQTVKCGHLTEYEVGNIKSHRKMRQGDSFQTSLLFKKSLYEVKTSGQHLSFNILS